MINGIINVYKEKGYTSHDVVAVLRRIFNQKKIGHTGTLDPDAVGVLPVCLGKGTKVSGLLTDKDKTYRAVLLLGVQTDTQDTTGQIIEQKEVTSTKEEIETAIRSFIGEYNQIPPMYSALKVNGKKLYELAREGIEIERKSRTVYINDIEVNSINNNEITMTVDCSKGTYIRTLCHDIGNILGCGGCMSSLERTRVSIFDIKDSIKLNEIDEIFKQGLIDNYITKTDEMFNEYSKVVVSKENNKIIYNGNKFEKKHLLVECCINNLTNKVRVYDEDGMFIGIYEYDVNSDNFRPLKIFFEE